MALPVFDQHHRDAQIQPPGVSQASRASMSCLPVYWPLFQRVWWPLPWPRRALAGQSFLDGFVVPQELCALWAGGSGAEIKPWGSSAAVDATRCVLAVWVPAPAGWSEAMPWLSLVLRAISVAWVGTMHHLCGLGCCYEPSHSMWLRRMTNTPDESCVTQLYRAVW